MAWIEQRQRADGGLSVRVLWRVGGLRGAPRQEETFSAGSNAQNRARTEGFKQMVEAAGNYYREPNPSDGGATNTIAGAHPAWRNDGPRTGDLLVTHGGGGAFSEPVNPLPGQPRGPQTTDNFLAVLGGSRLIANRGGLSGEVGPRFDDTLLNPHQSENVDVAPTALGLLGRKPPARVVAASSRKRSCSAGCRAAAPGSGAWTPLRPPPGSAGFG